MKMIVLWVKFSIEMESRNNLNTIISDSQVLYLLKVPEIEPNIYISMDDFNVTTGIIRGKGITGESILISADDLIPGKVGQAIHFYSDSFSF